MITDIQSIERLSRERRDENWEFRYYLKNTNISLENIDNAVHDLYREISAKIDCQKCANCCIVSSPVLKKADHLRLAKHIEMRPADFRNKYLVPDRENEGYMFRQMPCPFLRGKSCSVYDQCPTDCRSYPHLHKNNFVFRLAQAVENCSICPIVFNVYEELKTRFWKRRFRLL